MNRHQDRVDCDLQLSMGWRDRKLRAGCALLPAVTLFFEGNFRFFSFIFNIIITDSKSGLMVARAAALRTNINIDGRPLCSLPAHILRQVKVASTATAAQPQSGVIQESRLTAQARCGACFLGLVYV